MKSKFITLEYQEYQDVYRFWKKKINPSDYTRFPWGMFWKSIGLEYYESLPYMARKFKILNNNKWKQHWMLVKINNGSY